jgi:hypothetical protein
MKPFWFPVDQIPYKEMWPDDIFWLPEVITDKKIKARFTFAEGDVISEQEVTVVPDSGLSS